MRKKLRESSRMNPWGGDCAKTTGELCSNREKPQTAHSGHPGRNIFRVPAQAIEQKIRGVL